jgi:hypothetical protein
MGWALDWKHLYTSGGKLLYFFRVCFGGVDGAHVYGGFSQRVFLATVEVLDPEKRTPRVPGQGFYFVSSLFSFRISYGWM